MKKMSRGKVKSNTRQQYWTLAGIKKVIALVNEKDTNIKMDRCRIKWFVSQIICKKQGGIKDDSH